MTYVDNARKYYNYAKAGYQLGKKAYSLYNQYTESRMRQLPPPTAGVYTMPKTRGYIQPKKVLIRKTKYTKARITKARKVNKLVGKSVAKPIYRKNRATMRRFNKGKLSLQSRLQNGMSLPNTTFARMYWRGSNRFSTICGNPNYTGTGTVELNNKTFCLNDISQSPSKTPQMNHQVTYSSMWKQLYSEFQVLGAKFNIKITPETMQSNMPSNAEPPTSDKTRNNLLLNSIRGGFWYVRCRYQRAGSDGNRVPVGHFLDEVERNPKQLSTVEPIHDNKNELWWSSMRDFMSDPTVTWKRDNSVIRHKLHVHSPQVINPVNSPDFPAAANTISFEIEQNTKPVYLTCNFSAKKHFEEKNPLRNIPFTSWDESVGVPYRFMIRIGYIAFAQDGAIAYHVPLSRQALNTSEVDIKYFVALRNPKITPHGDTEPFSRFAMMPGLETTVDDDNLPDDDLLNEDLLDEDPLDEDPLDDDLLDDARS